MKEAIPEYWRYKICKEMGWDFYQYEMQPIFFRQQIMIFLIQEMQANAPLPVDEEEKRRVAALPPEEREVKVFQLER